MATIDKMHFNFPEDKKLWHEFVVFLSDHMDKIYNKTGKSVLQYVYHIVDSDSMAITNFPSCIDRYLWENCQISGIRDRLLDQYGSEETILNQPYDDVDAFIKEFKDEVENAIDVLRRLEKVDYLDRGTGIDMFLWNWDNAFEEEEEE